jgi:hypothetical protein
VRIASAKSPRRNLRNMGRRKTGRRGFVELPQSIIWPSPQVAVFLLTRARVRREIAKTPRNLESIMVKVKAASP